MAASANIAQLKLYICGSQIDFILVSKTDVFFKGQLVRLEIPMGIYSITINDLTVTELIIQLIESKKIDKALFIR